jgi:hypothetical protein
VTRVNELQCNSFRGSSISTIVRIQRSEPNPFPSIPREQRVVRPRGARSNRTARATRAVSAVLVAMLLLVAFGLQPAGAKDAPDARRDRNDRQAAAYGPFDSPRDFLEQQYDDLQPGPPTEYFFNPLLAAVEAGLPAEAAIEQVVTNANSFGTVGAIVRHYSAYFDRDPDTAGLRYWFNMFRSRHGISTMSAAFSESAEFRDTYGTLTNGQFVDLIYRNVLHRAPDAEGRAYWISFLDRGSHRWSIMTVFAESAENQAATRARVQRIIVHFGMLRRVPSDAWLDRTLDVPLQTVIRRIYNSPAYAARFAD